MHNFDIKKVQQYSTDDLREHMRLRDAEYRKSITIASDGRSYLDFVEWQQDAATIEANIEERLANRNKIAKTNVAIAAAEAAHLEAAYARGDEVEVMVLDIDEEFGNSFRGRQEE